MSLQSVTTGLSPRYYWRLNETSGTVAVDTMGVHNGTYFGGVTLGQPGITNGDTSAPLFNGTTGYVKTNIPGADPLMTTSTISISCWWKPSAAALTTNNGFFGNQPNVSSTYFYTNASGSGLVFSCGGGGPTATTAAFSTANIYHIAVTAPNGQLYLNGVAVGTATAIATGATPSGLFTIGASNGGVFFLAGVLSEVAVFSTQLTAANILAIYNAGIAPNPVITANALGPYALLLELI